MERSVSDPKYHKLATEYAKIRAQAGVLKKAVLDEQAKGTNLRDQLRQRETALRRAEQEVDSLGFCNKQLEHRVAVLQEEIAIREGRQNNNAGNDKQRAGHKFLALSFKGQDSKVVPEKAINDGAGDTLLCEELQKKIMENAQLTSLIEDKDRDLQLHINRINNLEQSLKQRSHEYGDLEKRLRREIETLINRNAELETKYEGAASLLGSEDALSVSGSEHTTFTANEIINKNSAMQYTQEDRIACLERELAQSRAQYEIINLTQSTGKCCNDKNDQSSLITAEELQKNACSCSSSAAGITISSNLNENKRWSEPLIPPTDDQIMHNSFSKKFEELLRDKCIAESHLASYITEMENLQNCLENATHELKTKEDQIQSINFALQMLEEDLATTRVNYEEQISVLTEQLVSLSEQLAACK